ncbi:DinB family protein [Tunturiibacter lichenicola]|jgi:uncharacterized damage-inducible protein DinB|uniref:DinB family protein n=1 Tax=Tunturiibacter lichenicola TaxID=2051959 RepID=UPI003D9B4216
MTIAEILLQDYDVEISNTRRTLERVPEGKNDWKCHDKSMPLGKLAVHCASLPLFGSYIILDDGMDLAKPTRPQTSFVFESRQACLNKLDEGAAACRNAIAAASDEALAAPWKFSYGEQIISNGPRTLAFRQMFFNHLVHHTAQLGVYLRLNDIPVPALYGPSADEQWSS